MSASRLDNFTDAAFAFAVSLLVIGGAGAPQDLAQLRNAVAEIPAFAFGFAIVVMFWNGHVRWRRMRGDGDGASAMLTLLLVFLTLIYIQPLRSMARSTAQFFTGAGTGFSGSATDLFLVYGTGFVAMALITAALFQEAIKRGGLNRSDMAVATGERGVWLILAATGVASILVSLTPFGNWAAAVYGTLPISVPLFAAIHDWEGTQEG